MWEKLDKLDNEFYNKYTILDLYDDIVDEYNRSKIDTKIANTNDINRFKRYIKRNYSSLNKNGKQKAKDFLNRVKIGNNEILQFILYILYNKKQNELNIYEKEMMINLVKYTYETETEEIARKLKRPRPKPPIWDDLVLILLANINARGYVWQSYVDGLVDYNSGETYRHLVVNGTKGLKDLLLKQKRRLINKKKEPSKDKFSGSLDDELVMIINETKIIAYKDMGIKKCKFIAVIDGVTTDMCEGLNNKIFLIDGINKYDRWSGPTKDKLVWTRYTTKGMKIGENLPPINSFFHYCRSTITYQIDNKKEIERIRNNESK